MVRIILFLVTNVAVTTTFALILAVTGIDSDSIYGILIISSLFGFSGSLVSLLISKWIALRSVNGRIIKSPTNDTEKWLIETIQKQAKQKGIKTPQIATYDALDINAFATGPRRNSALVAVSSGLLEKMTRNEAEAVIGHEISHISNGDMITMSLIQGVVNTFVIFISRIISQILNTVLLNTRDENDENEKHPFLFFIISTILEIMFGMLASIVTMWFSRHREFYADASSAKLVGCEKMISALNKLKSSYEPEESDSIIAFCINGKSKSLGKLFASHPSLDKRIEALNSKKYM